MLNPFIQCGSRIFVIDDWKPTIKEDHPLRIRPLTRKETVLYRKYTEDAAFEVWSLIVPGTNRDAHKKKPK